MPLSRGEPLRRLFFALWPPDGLREKIQEATRQVTTVQRGRIIPVANLHITIAFLGEVAQERVQAAMDGGTATTHAPVFDLCLDRIESMRRSRVLCLAPSSAPAQLAGLVDRLRFNLLDRQFKLQRQQFRPHLTLMRDLSRAPDAVAIAPLRWHVDSFALVESQLGRTGSQYSVLQRWKLGAEGASGQEKDQKNDRRNDDGNDSGR
jgi:RNA 2',3'-cyclic 3'-phosphodiesterase